MFSLCDNFLAFLSRYISNFITRSTSNIYTELNIYSAKSASGIERAQKISCFNRLIFTFFSHIVCVYKKKGIEIEYFLCCCFGRYVIMLLLFVDKSVSLVKDRSFYILWRERKLQFKDNKFIS